MPDYVLTMIAAEKARAVAGDSASAIARALERDGVNAGAPDWLAPDLACDIFFDGATPNAAEHAARAALAGRAIDLVVQPASGRRKALLVADMESTLIENEMLDEMADLVGLRGLVAEITRRAMNGESDFADSLRQRVALFEGQPASILSAAATGIRFVPGAAALARTMIADGAAAILISGGFDVFSRPVRDALGFTRDYANELIVEDGRLAGAVREPILAGAGKREILRRCAAEFGVALEHTLAIGDGANDLPMLRAAGLGIAYHAKPGVQAEIATRIDHADLTALLYLQGYRAEEIIG